MPLTPRQSRFFVDDNRTVAMPPGWTPFQLLKRIYDEEGLPPPLTEEDYQEMLKAQGPQQRDWWRILEWLIFMTFGALIAHFL